MPRKIKVGGYATNYKRAALVHRWNIRLWKVMDEVNKDKLMSYARQAEKIGK